MLTITIEDVELFNDETNEFYFIEGGTFRFEHSLYAISEWEAKWKRPYLIKEPYTQVQERDYYHRMCLDTGLKDHHLTDAIVNKLIEYISDTQTATIIQNDDNSGGAGKTMTSEVVYALMASAQVPFECDRWNFNRLLVLLRVVADQHAPKKKMTRDDILRQNTRLNEERRKKHKTKG